MKQFDWYYLNKIKVTIYPYILELYVILAVYFIGNKDQNTGLRQYIYIYILTKLVDTELPTVRMLQFKSKKTF